MFDFQRWVPDVGYLGGEGLGNRRRRGIVDILGTGLGSKGPRCLGFLLGALLWFRGFRGR